MSEPETEQIENGYRLWYDDTSNRWRFAGTWRDDGLGGTLHGARATRELAIAGAAQNHLEHEQMRTAEPA